MKGMQTRLERLERPHRQPRWLEGWYYDPDGSDSFACSTRPDVGPLTEAAVRARPRCILMTCVDRPADPQLMLDITEGTNP